mmetsp:Transcript_17516/g.21570  ORF Transcript_17516/g.21570 Transcript_17516/m.21570 type:complete len:94 (-) Transcript_17516:1152-1433(-)
MKTTEPQVQLACELNLPLFLHERDAHDDFVRILEKYKEQLPPLLVHCFTGSDDELTKYVEMGCYLSLSGSIFKSNTCDCRRYDKNISYWYYLI